MTDTFQSMVAGLFGIEQGACPQIRSITYTEKTNTLHLEMDADLHIPPELCEQLKQTITDRFYYVSDVMCNFSYTDSEHDEEDEIIRRFLPVMKHACVQSASLMHTVDLNQFRDDGSVLTFDAVGERAVRQLNETAAPEMQRMLMQEYAIQRLVRFCNKEDQYDQRIQSRKEQEQKELDQAAREAAEAARAASLSRSDAKQGSFYPGGGERKKTKRSYEGPVRGNQILGRHVDGEPIPVRDVERSSGPVIVEGSVFKKDSVTTKNGRVIMILYLTDKTYSVALKAFLSEKKWNDIDEHIREGTCIRAAGRCENDSFEKMMVLMTDSIETIDPPQGRVDTAERKRVELHAHTNMSQIDGLMDVKDLVNTAKAWGHAAVAVTDHGVVQSFPDAASAAGDEIKVLYGVEGYLVNAPERSDGTLDYKSVPAYHVILLAKNQTGLVNLYKLVSYSYMDYHYKRPRMPKSVIEQHREGIIIGAACEAGEVFRAMTGGASDEELEQVASFYDYLEIQPRSNNYFMLEKGMVSSEEDLLEYNRRIVRLGERTGKPVVATCDAHYRDPEDYIYRNIIMAAHGFRDLSESPRLWLRTTDEMLEEFSYLGRDTAEKVVIDNPNMIADTVEVMKPVPDGKFPPKIDGAEERLRNRCYEKAHSIYGNPLPAIVEERLEKELTSVIDNGYAVMYVAAEMLVQKSLSDGYLVGSRGSVGSSLAATMDGITEVNPLPPHYICPECHHSEFVLDGSYDCGVDMPDKRCPVCGAAYRKDGFNIPFETFLGFSGNKEPDIDLNFAGEYQATAHKYVEEIFGAKNVYKAGTISTIKEKTALAYVRKYFEERGGIVGRCEAERLARGCTGVRKTTGQHPGGIVVVPDDHEIYEFCPVMHPSEGAVRDITTTHFDYHKIDKNLLKLDILGHDVPSMIRMLQDMTGVAPDDIPLSDPKVNSIFLGTDALNIQINDYRQKHGTFGIPEFGTPFTRQMLDDTQPEKFTALVRIAGFSHGTDVWLNNAQEFIRSGDATMDDAIATRDDIMNYLIQKELPKKEAFTIMEKVRKGKGLTEEQETLMREHDVPEWYIESCKRIKYMFPKAHAVAYVMMSYRIAFFKVYYPAEFYAVHFTVKVDAFNAGVILGGMDAVTSRMDEIDRMGKEATNKDQDEYLVYEVAYEMYARGLEFLPAELGVSDSMKFTVENGKVRIPFRALEGMGETAARSLTEEYEKRRFSSIEDMMTRTTVNSSNLEMLRGHGILDGMQESDQMSLFDLATCGA